MGQNEDFLDGPLEKVLRSPCCRAPFDIVAEGRLCKKCAALYELKDGILVLLLQAAQSGPMKGSSVETFDEGCFR